MESIDRPTIQRSATGLIDEIKPQDARRFGTQVPHPHEVVAPTISVDFDTTHLMGASRTGMFSALSLSSRAWLISAFSPFVQMTTCLVHVVRASAIPTAFRPVPTTTVFLSRVSYPSQSGHT